ncbi:hypothetical protein CLU79DRAFT_832825 [Phycomyces nitens]|nr:hypothetical protein CLU79DRAFT_832825 [Phycomyces nitens]
MEEEQKEAKEKEKVEMEKEDKGCQPTPNAESPGPSTSNIPLVQESEEDEDNNTETSEPRKPRSRAIRLRDCLVNDQRAQNINIEDHNNSAYLAAFLHILGPEKAKKTKHCILNGFLTIGYENQEETTEYSYCLSDKITTSGPGATCKYQRDIDPSNVRYLSTDMIDKLESAHNTDEISHIEIFVTMGQIFFTSITCNDTDGDRWVKVILIMYTLMSVLQTASLFILHKQTTAFSIKDDQELSSEAINPADYWEFHTDRNSSDVADRYLGRLFS